MLTIVLALSAAVILPLILNFFFPEFIGPVWTTFLAIVGFLAVSIPLNLIIRKKQERIFRGVQNMIEENQNVLRRRINQMQNKMASSPKGLQKQLEKQQSGAIEEAIEMLQEADSLKKWNVLAEKQTNTLRGQLAYQIKDFAAADRYFDNCLALDPLTVAMKMTRLYKRGETEALAKLFKKKKKRFKTEDAAIFYALYSWILVKEERIEDAIEVLDDARKKTENPVLQANWEHLVNGRQRQFSNAALGDLWYSLHLETPKQVRVKQRRGGKLR